MVMKKDFREKQRLLWQLTTELNEVTTTHAWRMLDAEIVKVQSELTLLEQEYNGEIPPATQEQGINELSEYPLAVLTKEKDELKDTLNQIEAGKFTRISAEGLQKMQNRLHLDIAELDKAIAVLKTHTRAEEELG